MAPSVVRIDVEVAHPEREDSDEAGADRPAARAAPLLPVRRAGGAGAPARHRLGRAARRCRQHRHQPARGLARHEGQRDVLGRHRDGGPRGGRRSADRRGGRAPGPAATPLDRGSPRRLGQARGGRVGAGGRQPARPGSDRHGRHHQRQGACGPPRPDVGRARAQLHPDGRQDQPRQLGRATRESGGRGGRHQHAHQHRAGRRLRVRDPHQSGAAGGAGAHQGWARSLSLPGGPARRSQGADARGACLVPAGGRGASCPARS